MTWGLMVFIEYSWGLIIGLHIFISDLFGGVFSYVLVIDFHFLIAIWFVKAACMLYYLSATGTFVPGARLSSWWGDDLSFVISSPVPSIRIASVVNGYVRESGRCCCMAKLPLFLSWVLFPIVFVQYTFDNNFYLFTLIACTRFK